MNGLHRQASLLSFTLVLTDLQKIFCITEMKSGRGADTTFLSVYIITCSDNLGSQSVHFLTISKEKTRHPIYTSGIILLLLLLFLCFCMPELSLEVEDPSKYALQAKKE